MALPVRPTYILALVMMVLWLVSFVYVATQLVFTTREFATVDEKLTILEAMVRRRQRMPAPGAADLLWRWSSMSKKHRITALAAAGLLKRRSVKHRQSSEENEFAKADSTAVPPSVAFPTVAMIDRRRQKRTTRNRFDDSLTGAEGSRSSSLSRWPDTTIYGRLTVTTTAGTLVPLSPSLADTKDPFKALGGNPLDASEGETAGAGEGADGGSDYDLSQDGSSDHAVTPIHITLFYQLASKQSTTKAKKNFSIRTPRRRRENTPKRSSSPRAGHATVSRTNDTTLLSSAKWKPAERDFDANVFSLARG